MKHFLILLFLFAFHAQAQDSVEVIELKYRSAEQLVPIVQPLVGKDGAVTGMQNKLIIRATPARLREVKQVIANLDTRPRRLLISVRQNVSRDSQAQEASVHGTVGGDHARIRVPETPPEGGASVDVGGGDTRIGGKVVSTRDIEDSRDSQQIQVMEGNSAFIRMGQTIPYSTKTLMRDGRRITVVEDTQYRDVTSGFYVRPRVSGDLVTLEISPQRNTVGAGGSVNIQQAATTVTGRLGEWIELGGIGSQSNTAGSGTVYSTRDVTRDQRAIFVRVQEIQ